MYDDFDYLYVCDECGKFIEFTEFIEFDNLCENCYKLKYPEEYKEWHIH